MTIHPLVARLARKLNAELKRQFDAAPAPGREFDPESWTATGGAIDLSAIARAAILETLAGLEDVSDAVLAAGDEAYLSVVDEGAADISSRIWDAMRSVIKQEIEANG